MPGRGVGQTKIELDGISLNETQSRDGGIAEARSVSNVHATDSRNIVLHTVPGMEGSAIQDLGRTAVGLSFDGIVMGAGAKNIIEMLRSKFKLGEPITFNSDISGTADVTKAIIDDFKIINVAGNKDRYDYSIRLKEFKEPPQQQSTPPSQDEEAGAWADGVAGDTEQSINTGSGLGEKEEPSGVESAKEGEAEETAKAGDELGEKEEPSAAESAKEGEAEQTAKADEKLGEAEEPSSVGSEKASEVEQTAKADEGHKVEEKEESSGIESEKASEVEQTAKADEKLGEAEEPSAVEAKGGEVEGTAKADEKLGEAEEPSSVGSEKESEAGGTAKADEGHKVEENETPLEAPRQVIKPKEKTTGGKKPSDKF